MKDLMGINIFLILSLLHPPEGGHVGIESETFLLYTRTSTVWMTTRGHTRLHYSKFKHKILYIHQTQVLSDRIRYNNNGNSRSKPLETYEGTFNKLYITTICIG